MCNYMYNRINGKEYITVEWKTDDYIYGKKLFGYYILEKIGGNFMEEMFEKKEKIYSILSSKKCGLVLGKDIYLPQDKRGNENALIVAGSGAGKSAAFTIPNVLNMLGNYVITDPWGEIYENTHKYLEKNGYLVKTINYEDCENNYKYNPLNHIRTDNDIDILTDILVGSEDDDFGNESVKCLIKTILYYVMANEEKKDLLTCFKLISLSKEELFKKLEIFPGDSKISKYYSILKTFPEKTYSSVVSTAIMKLAFVINQIPESREFEEKFNFEDLANNSKIAIFLICKQENKEDKKMINIFISQLLSQLTIFNTGKEHIYILLDEINMFGKIYELARKIETSRPKKISICMLTNNLEKLNKIYGDDFYTIINSIDTQLFLGSMLKYDIDYFSNISGVDNKFIKNDLVRDKLLIYEKGLKPIIVEKQYFFNNEEWKEIL